MLTCWSYLYSILASETFQDALQELKMAIKASGEHKQKVGFLSTVLFLYLFSSLQVNIQIAVDGLKIRDEKTGVRNTFSF